MLKVPEFQNQLKETFASRKKQNSQQFHLRIRQGLGVQTPRERAMQIQTGPFSLDCGNRRHSVRAHVLLRNPLTQSTHQSQH